jgi:hypothetical protein
MSLYDDILSVYPELTNDNFGIQGQIVLSDDLDETGAYIAKWDYTKPIPNGLKLGK